MSLLLIAMAWSAPAGWERFDTQGGCAFYRSPNGASGYPTLQAECVWDDVTVEELDGHLAKLGDHDLVHESVATSDVTQDLGGGSYLVHQTHVASGISDRVADLTYTRSVSGDTITYAWEMAATQPTPGAKQVVPAKDTGFWKLTPSPGGGAVVVYNLAYEPGGSVPAFVVKAFQTSGFVQLATELHVFALANQG